MDKQDRYELGMTIGPCSENESEALAEAILNLPEFQRVSGGAVAISRLSPGEVD